MENYQFYGRNRQTMKESRKGLGGIGIFIRNSLLECFDVEECYANEDYVLGLKLQWKNNINSHLALYCVYLPPESSKYGTKNEHILNLLTIELYRQEDADNVIICGDFNARIGEKEDCQYIDGMQPRIPLDKETNTQGNKLLTFINDIRGCIVNGRISPDYDFFTSTAPHKGNAVVDYVIVRQSDLHSVKSCKVQCCMEVMDRLKCSHLVSDKC